MPDTKTTGKGTSRSRKGGNVWSEQERAAMQEGARERKAASRRDPAAAREEGERDVLAKIATMSDSDRAMAERIHALVASVAPALVPRTFYGMPAYSKDGKVLCFFKPAATYKERYATFGFQDNANLDEGSMWPTAWALTKLTAADEKRIAELVKKAAS